ncbi:MULTISPECIES: cobalamin biosynthesis protein [unclassified Caballeronia]|uniref:cobalamin biosynthesis protein n=1 Tax=unclassified Caballeronia TaxID=2646786 RepID=UPI00285AEFD7|nr:MULTISPECIES: cobalamin biosynthesis protein [unclassified Caballeronia]MDR5754089.1 cobalamin biosynthesis protein [Caballeronia sp. LZ024]MDR5840467.1 cobalamin biosynthesis protein [Caballeronia sp. LZ031]
MTTLSIVLGIGCRRGVSVEEIEAAVQRALDALDAPGAHALANVRAVASIEGKSDGAALLAFCERHRLTLQLFTAQQIEGVDTHARASAQVRKHLGVGGVCEPCALLASHEGRIVVPKTIVDDVTVAIAADHSIHHSKSHA